MASVLCGTQRKLQSFKEAEPEKSIKNYTDSFMLFPDFGAYGNKTLRKNIITYKLLQRNIFYSPVAEHKCLLLSSFSELFIETPGLLGYKQIFTSHPSLGLSIQA